MIENLEDEGSNEELDTLLFHTDSRYYVRVKREAKISNFLLEQWENETNKKIFWYPWFASIIFL